MAQHLSKWVNDNGFRFPAQKTVYVAFTRRGGTSAEPSLHLAGNILSVCDKHKFLGVIFDKMLSFVLH